MTILYDHNKTDEWTSRGKKNHGILSTFVRRVDRLSMRGRDHIVLDLCSIKMTPVATLNSDIGAAPLTTQEYAIP